MTDKRSGKCVPHFFKHLMSCLLGLGLPLVGGFALMAGHGCLPAPDALLNAAANPATPQTPAADTVTADNTTDNSTSDTTKPPQAADATSPAAAATTTTDNTSASTGTTSQANAGMLAPTTNPAAPDNQTSTPVATPPAIAGAPMTTANRTSGVAPLAVFFDAVDEPAPSPAIPAWTSGVVQPSGDYAGFDYNWDFGDPNSGSFATTGKSKNTATGYVAAHVYEQPGTYTVSLSVKDAAGQMHYYNQTITVSAFSGTTYYISSSSGSDSNDGLSASTPWQSFDKAFQNIGSNRQFLFKRGDSFSTGGGFQIKSAGPGVIGAYGTGNAPVVNVSGTSGGIVLYNSDWRIMDLNFVGPGGTTDQQSAITFDPAQGINNNLMLRLGARNFRVGIGWSDYNTMYSTPHDGNCIQECQVANTNINGIFVGGRRLAILGNKVQDIDVSHVLRVWQGHKCVIENNSLHNPGPTRHALKLHSPTHGDGRPETKFAEIADNDIIGKTWSAALGPEDNQNDERVDQVVFERNIFHSEASVTVDLSIWARDVTVRDNVFVGAGSSAWYTAVGISQRGIEPPPLNINVFNNTAYKSDSGSQFIFCDVAGVAANVTVRNNLASAPNISSKMLIQGGCSGLVQDHNLLTDTPGFAGATDFHLQAGSPAVDAGAAINDVGKDYTGTARPQGGGYDLGAYERTP